MNGVVPALLLLAGSVQEEADCKSFIIPKQERSAYVPALQKFREAEAALADPPECIRRCTELIEDKGVRDAHRDARLKIQNTDGSYGDWALFAPHQLRGRAHLTRAEALAASDRREAARQAQLAVADLEESQRRGLKSSEEALGRARKLHASLKESDAPPNERHVEAKRRLEELRTLRDQKGPPEALLDRCASAAAIFQETPYEEAWRSLRADAFKAAWSGPAGAARFRTARASVSKLGGFLTEAERKKVLDEIAAARRSFVADAIRSHHAQLRELLPDQETWPAFVRVPAAEIGQRLALPEPEELDGEPEEMARLRSCRDRLLRARGTDVPAAPIEAFLETLGVLARTSVEAAGDPRAFPPLEALVRDLATRRLERCLPGASAEEPEGLAVRRSEVRRIIDAMESFAADLGRGGAALPPKHLDQIRSYADRLPIDPPRLDEIGRGLLDPSDPKGLWGRSLDLARDYEAELSKLDPARLSKAARRKRGTYLLVAGVARLLLSGKSAADVARLEELRTLARKLQADGGPPAEVMALVSPRVRTVVDLLKD